MGMFYVAADPKQPGAAFAACRDEPQFQNDTAESISDWVKRGAHVMRVDSATMMTMLTKWKHPVTDTQPTQDTSP